MKYYFLNIKQTLPLCLVKIKELGGKNDGETG